METWHLQTIIYLQKVRQDPPVLQGSNLEMVDRGLLDSVPDVLETWNLKHDTPGLTLPPEGVSRTSCPPRIQPGDGGRGSSWQCSWCPRDLKFETWHPQGLLYLQKVCQEHPVLQGSNLEMVDRVLLDSVPDPFSDCKLFEGSWGIRNLIIGLQSHPLRPG